MIKRTAIIWLVGLFCFNSVSGFFMVICQNSDGRVAVEPVFHSHCECPDIDNPADYAVAISSSADHDHCSDFVAVSNLVVPSKSTVRQSAFKAFTSCFIQKTDLLVNTPVVGFFAAQGDGFASFHVPLRNVILLV
jgi:hypothetical protein